MQKTIGVTELQRRFKAVLDEVVKERVPYVLARGRQPEAAIIPYDDFLRFQEMVERQRRIREHWERSSAELAARNAQLTDEDVEADVETIVDEVRAELWERQQAQPR